MATSPEARFCLLCRRRSGLKEHAADGHGPRCPVELPRKHGAADVFCHGPAETTN